MSRVEKVASLLKKEIALIIQRTLNDKRIGFISITDVKVSKDLHHAKVKYSQLGGDKEETKRGLSSAMNA